MLGMVLNTRELIISKNRQSIYTHGAYGLMAGRGGGRLLLVKQSHKKGRIQLYGEMSAPLVAGPVEGDY